MSKREWKKRPVLEESMSEATSEICKKSPNVYKSCPKMISLEKLKILTPLQKLLKNVWDLGKLIVAKGFKKLPKVQKIATSGHTGSLPVLLYQALFHVIVRVFLA